MLFEVNQEKKCLGIYRSNWDPKELELEEYLISKTEEEVATLNSSVFGESLLIINSEVRTGVGKRADILALDHMGNAVIIELKRHNSSLGVDTQALQYLAEFSKYKGDNFIKQFSPEREQDIRGFLGDVNVQDINKNSRIILIARCFDPGLYSMGEWLSGRGIAFRCIEYTPVEYENKRFISFSVAFDRSPFSIFPLTFENQLRQPGYFWHNIGEASNDWWQYLVKAGQISTSFDCQPGDQGEKILRSYIKGDTIIAYAKKFGAIGWGVINKPESYDLLKPGCKDDKMDGLYLHRLNIDWKFTVEKIEDAIGPSELLQKKYGIFHPRTTSAKIDRQKAKLLINDMHKGNGFLTKTP